MTDRAFLARACVTAVGFLLGAALPALATPQIPEVALIDGAIYYIPVEGVYRNVPPLQMLWERPMIKLGLTGGSTACWRQYVGIWEVREDTLYLRALDAFHDPDNEKKVSMKAVFPERLKNGRVKADWFSGPLTFTPVRLLHTDDHFALRFVKGRMERPNALRDFRAARGDFSPPPAPELFKEPFTGWQPKAQSPEMFLLDGIVYYLPAEQSERAFPVERLWDDPQLRPQFSTYAEGLTGPSVARGYRALWEVHENELYMLAIDSWVDGAKAHLKTLLPDRFKDGRVRADWFSGELDLMTWEHAPLLAQVRKQDPPLDSPKITLRIKDGRLLSTTEHRRIIDWDRSRGIAGSYGDDRGMEGNRDVVAFADFEDDAWRRDWSGGRRRTVSVVGEDAERGFEPLQGKALRIKVKRGGHYGASLQYRFKDRTGSEPEEVYFRHYLRFGSDWDPVRGGKLPGISGTYGRAGWGGRPSNGRNGWSARGQFQGRKDGKTPIGFYCYHAEMKGRYGSAWIWDDDGLGYLENNRWYCIEQYAKMNTPGQKDGILRGWVDGQLAFEKTDVRMRDLPDLKIECIWINVYHGGTWSAASDDHLFIDNIVIAKRYIGPMAAHSTMGSETAGLRDE